MNASTLDQLDAAFENGQTILHSQQEAERARRPHGVGVFIPLLASPEGYQVLFEVRALDLERQPGEVCFPGGHIEEGEDGVGAALRETCEELAVAPSQVTLHGVLAPAQRANGDPLQVCYGVIADYRNTWSSREVDHTFTVPLQWFLMHEPTIYEGKSVPVFGDDFPWEAIPGGRSYRWFTPRSTVTFYFGTKPLIWGLTAHAMHRFISILRAGGISTDRAFRL
ncbi:MAG: NUDIX hydrolase [Eggerthellaceae bacterium]|jgi:coenzyme A diphosphatase NUDT7